MLGPAAAPDRVSPWAGVPAPRTEDALEELLSRPTQSLSAALSPCDGDVVILGAGGTMGPSLARMARRALPGRRIIAVSRWTGGAAADELRSHDVEVLRADLRDGAAVRDLPDAPNVVFMAGQKFGTSDDPNGTWAMNAGVPTLAAERYAGARVVVFSTGNVYPLTLPEAGGSRETDAPAPVGEYAWSCLARERIWSGAAARHGTAVAIVRLNYAHDLRYGVLTDLARRIVAREPIDLAMGWVNVIWQGDANAIALAALRRATTPEPFVVNVAGRDALRVADLARALGERLGVSPNLRGEEQPDALLSDSARMRDVLDDPLLPLETLLDWVTGWIHGGGRLLGKSTSFEQRDGRF